jgi:hypothetical protein
MLSMLYKLSLELKNSTGEIVIEYLPFLFMFNYVPRLKHASSYRSHSSLSNDVYINDGTYLNMNQESDFSIINTPIKFLLCYGSKSNINKT